MTLKMTMLMTDLVPPHGYHPCNWNWCHIRQYNAHMLPLSNRPHPQGLSLMTLLLQVCPRKPNSHHYHCHFQECPRHQALSPIAQGHVCMELVQYHILPAKTTWPQNTLSTQYTGLCQSLALSEPEMTEFACLCTRLSTLNKGNSLAVLDQKSGQLLKHCQLQRDPRNKEVWYHSYSNKLRHLCQGIGTGDKSGSK
jgi:hypothetical protein